MALTEVPIELSSTPGIVDNSTGTAITIDASNNTNFADNVKAIFGASGDLQIYHDGSNSYIKDLGTGDLLLSGNTGVQIQSDAGENMITTAANGAVSLFYDASAKLATTSTGIDVTGTVTADGLEVLSADTVLSASIGTAAQRVYITPDGTKITYNASGNSAGSHMFQTGNVSRFNIAANGDITFYEDTGTTAKFFWDASAESLNIGTTSGTTDRRLHITGTGPSTAVTQFGIVANPSYPTSATAAVFNLYTGPNLASGTTLTNLYNVYLEANNTTGSTVTNSFGLYQAGSGDKNYFAGNVGIGNTVPTGKLTISEAAGANAPTTVTAANTYLQLGSADYGPSSNGKFMIGFGYTDGTTNTNSPAYIGFEEETNTGDTYGSLTFYTRNVISDTAPTERMRIDSSGNLLVGTPSATNSTHTIQKDGASTNSLVVTNSSSSTPSGLQARYSAVDPNSTSSNFFEAYGFNGSSYIKRFEVRSNGGIGNFQANDVNLSDERVKTDIAPLGSMWDKFKALEIVTFKYKDQTHDDNNIGVIAQQVEAVAPEFVDNEGFGETPEGEEPLKAIYTADMYHAAIRALQEAMDRIETLEAKVAQLEGAN